MPKLLFALMLAMLVARPALAFKFSDDEQQAAAEEAARRDRIAQLVSVPCRERIKGQKIMTVIAERTGNGLFNVTQSRYGPHFQAINRRLRALGLKTYTQEEIRAQIAQAELEAYFRNDPDAALAASRKLGASFILRGLISTQASINPVLRLPEVTVTMGFTLTGANGRIISDASARAESYSGSDTLGMALTLVNEQADELVAQLYNDFCRGGQASGKSKR
jgi:hypothetical protein